MLYSAGRYLDFLPKGVNKGSTLHALVQHLGVDPNSVLVAGDTLNEYEEQGQMRQRPHRSPNGIIPTLLSFFGDRKKGSS